MSSNLMNLLGKGIDQVTEADLQKLIGTPEGKALDFKKDKYGDSDKDKREFLADISSFANTIGGVIAIGIEEKQGVAAGICGIGNDIDKEKLRLEALVLTGLQPRVFGVVIHSIVLSNHKNVLLIDIPQSWSGPHRVIKESSNRFFCRHGSGKYEPDVDELRKLFVGTEVLEQRIRDFRHERIAKVAAADTQIPINNASSSLVLHIIPYSAYNRNNILSIKQIGTGYHHLCPMEASGYNFRINFEGLITYTTDTIPVPAYTQIWRNGSIESLRCPLVSAQNHSPSSYIERAVVSGSFNYLKALQQLGINPPLVIFITLVGVKGSFLVTSNYNPREKNGFPFDREITPSSGVIISEYPEDIKKLAQELRSSFDEIYNAAGYIGSPNFNDEGEWTGAN